MARILVIDNGILPCQEAFPVDAPTPRTSPRRWIQAKCGHWITSFRKTFMVISMKINPFLFRRYLSDTTPGRGETEPTQLFCFAPL